MIEQPSTTCSQHDQQSIDAPALLDVASVEAPAPTYGLNYIMDTFRAMRGGA
jgi:hypothetical protein